MLRASGPGRTLPCRGAGEQPGRVVGTSRERGPSIARHKHAGKRGYAGAGQGQLGTMLVQVAPYRRAKVAKSLRSTSPLSSRSEQKKACSSQLGSGPLSP